MCPFICPRKSKTNPGTRGHCNQAGGHVMTPEVIIHLHDNDFMFYHLFLRQQWEMTSCFTTHFYVSSRMLNVVRLIMKYCCYLGNVSSRSEKSDVEEKSKMSGKLFNIRLLDSIRTDSKMITVVKRRCKNRKRVFNKIFQVRSPSLPSSPSLPCFQNLSKPETMDDDRRPTRHHVTPSSQGYSQRAVLMPVPEAPGRRSVGEQPHLSGHRAPPDSTTTVGRSASGTLTGRSASGQSAAETPRRGARTPFEEEGPASNRVREWPADQEARGPLTLKATFDHRASRRVVCSIMGGVLKLSDTSGATGASSIAVVAEVPVVELAIGLQRGRESMFMLATLHKGKIYDEIYCFADDQVKRNKWIAVFRRIGVRIFDMSDGVAASRPVVFTAFTSS